MLRFGLLVLFFITKSISAGTVNCDSDDGCQKLICSNNEKPYCDIIENTTGPNARPMGFCRCK